MDLLVRQPRLLLGKSRPLRLDLRGHREEADLRFGGILLKAPTSILVGSLERLRKITVLNTVLIRFLERCRNDNLLILMARPKGFEPLTPRFVVWCSIQLSYGRP